MTTKEYNLSTSASIKKEKDQSVIEISDDEHDKEEERKLDREKNVEEETAEEEKKNHSHIGSQSTSNEKGKSITDIDDELIDEMVMEEKLKRIAGFAKRLKVPGHLVDDLLEVLDQSVLGQLETK